MTDPNTVLAAIADELRALAEARATPPDALARMRALAARHDARIELVYERDAAGDAYHFDALLEEAAGTITVRFCPDRGQPFLLRGAERLSDRDLVRVGGETLTVADAIAQLDFIWRDRPIMKRLIDACLVQAALRADPVELTDERVQAALDRIRLANGLHGAAETLAWMAERGLTHARLEAHAAEQAAILGLRDRIAGAAEVAAHFTAHRADYDVATLARIALPDTPAGRAVAEQIQADRLELGPALAAAVRAGFAPEREAPVIARVRRRELAGEARELAFDPAARGPRVLRERGRVVVIHVIAIDAATLDDATAERVAADLFEAWLAERRAAATIEWGWGSVEQTRRAG